MLFKGDTLIPMPTDIQNPKTVLSPEDICLDQLDRILSEMRETDDETPQWEFCEGFMVALICCRRPISDAQWLPALFDLSLNGDAVPSAFTYQAQFDRFMTLWQQRRDQIAQSLDTDIDTLADERAYMPRLLDVRGVVGSLTPRERRQFKLDLGHTPLPSYGQIWAVGFMYAVETWPEEWTAPRDRDVAKLLDAALQSIVALTEDDTGAQTIILSDDKETVPSLSEQRMDTLANALWGVYDLRALWQQFGPRVTTVHRTATPGRNDPCSCGSGKKYKKCCGSH